ncbi:MAG TPA: protein kinase [Streptomyces sp.]|uniref:protein kinase domain-containing protein n=1 Tax=Streptomyces sp. TaxID=1931 RepID=UPI002CB3D27F|nr:protein kinase [Streptomyces sp.]HWU05288.1 protein kinase [Streptomyces sp.]
MRAQNSRVIPEIVRDHIKPITEKEIVSRRGSTVWRCTSLTGEHAIKIGYPIEATTEWPAQEWTALAPAREAFVLRDVLGQRIAFGEWSKGTWNVQPWRTGVSLYDLWASNRKSSALPSAREIIACCEALDRLHSMGWIHGDVQPAHLIVAGTRTPRATLIDVALAQGKSVPERFDFPYRGCLVHYEAPEISESVLSGGKITPTQASDVYALGASLLMSLTGQRHVEYPDDASRSEQRRAIVSRRHRPISVPGSMGRLIRAMLQRVPDDRPSARDVAVEVAGWET